MKSIRFRVIATYLIVILLTILLFGIGVYSFIQNYYINNIESILINGQEICSDIYNELYYQYDIDLEPAKIGERFIPYTRAQVLLLDKSGGVLYDSTDTYYRGHPAIEKDLENILDGETAVHRENSILGERTMSVSRVLKSGDTTIGILKLSASLEEVYKVMSRVMLILMAGGLVIIVIVSFAALIIANTIIKPIGKITDHISDIASGDLKPKKGSKFNSEFSNLTDNLNNLSEELESNKKMQEQFIESVSHELRTPLTSIKGWIVTLKNSRTEDKELMEEGLEIINTEADRLTGLVEDLLEFPGYANRLTQMKKTDMTGLLKYVCRQMKPRANRLNIGLSCNSTGEEITVKGDYDRLKQVLINLIDNALKYSRQGDDVNISCITNENYAAITVKDNGPGFDPNDIELIFNKKYQSKNAKTGSGLGLAISKEIVEAHGGDIRILTGGEGTTVTFRIPVTGD